MREQQLGLKVDGDCADEAFTVVVDDGALHLDSSLEKYSSKYKFLCIINVLVVCISVYNGIIHGRPVMDDGKHISTCI